MKSHSKAGARPKLACEISADRVLGGLASDHGQTLVSCAGRQLRAGSVMPDLTEANLRYRDEVSGCIREVLADVGAKHRDVVAVLPDAAVRVVLLDFDMLPSDRQEAEGVVRFRLKKSLPFDVDKAKVSYHAQTAGQSVRLVAAVALSSVVEEYEAAFQDAGYSPGLVMPSMLAALGAADAQRPTLVLKVDARTISIAILNGGHLLLLRTLENMRGSAISGEQLAEEVYPSVVFFQDTYELNLDRILVAGISDSERAAQALKAQTGTDVQELVTAEHLGRGAGEMAPRYRMAGVVGALIS
jgi:type IV pilus assembly protein PilM